MSNLVRIFILLAVLGFQSESSYAHGLGAHVHGVASLQVAVDGDVLSLELSGPLDNLIGFEHAPRNDKEKAVVKKMREFLLDAGAVFVPTPSAACVKASVKLESAVLDGGKPEEGGHADIDGDYQFKCAHPEKLQDLEVKLFDRFSKLQTVNAQVAGPRGQSAAKLTPQNRRVNW